MRARKKKRCPSCCKAITVECRSEAVEDALLEKAWDAPFRAHLLAASTKESGAWLNVLPITSLGLRMDDNTVKVAVVLHLATTLCRPYASHHYGTEADCLSTHGLSAKQVRITTITTPH